MVIITGDVAGVSDTNPPVSVAWNEGVGYGSYGFDEFWNDTYLMWELAHYKGGFPDDADPNDGSSVDHIFVLYGDGIDYGDPGFRYDPFEWHRIEEEITDYPAGYSNVEDIFHWLANGNAAEGIEPMNDWNFLFVYTFDHGGVIDGHSTLYLRGAQMRDDVFASLLAPISYWRRVFWMQQCHSGGFIDDLENQKTIITTACKEDEHAYRADNVSYNGSPLPENETYENREYHHGEFNFHIMNAVRGEAIYPYDDPPKVYANTDVAPYVSFNEAFLYLYDHDSRFNIAHIETPQHSDPGNIGNGTFLAYGPLRPPSPPLNLHKSVCGWSQSDDEMIDEGNVILSGLQWTPNEEPDIHYYKIYENGIYLDWTNSTCYPLTFPNPIPQTYTYYVTAVDVYGFESDPSNTVTFLPPDGGGSGGGQSAGVNKLSGLSLEVIPNQITSGAVIKVTNLHREDVKVEVYNVTGTKVETIYEGIINKGINSFRWIPDDRYSKGIYLITLSAGDRIITEKVIINR